MIRLHNLFQTIYDGTFGVCVCMCACELYNTLYSILWNTYLLHTNHCPSNRPCLFSEVTKFVRFYFSCRLQAQTDRISDLSSTTNDLLGRPTIRMIRMDWGVHKKTCSMGRFFNCWRRCFTSNEILQHRCSSVGFFWNCRPRRVGCLTNWVNRCQFTNLIISDTLTLWQVGKTFGYVTVYFIYQT